MGWKFLQIAVATSFLFFNVYVGLIDNPYSAAITAGFLAFSATWLLSKSISLLSRWRQLLPVHQSRDDRSHSGIGSGQASSHLVSKVRPARSRQ